MINVHNNAFLKFCVGVFLVITASAIFVNVDALSPTSLEPLGPAAFPKAISVVIAVLALVFTVKAAMHLRRVTSAKESPREYRRRYDLAGATVLLTVVYVSLFGFEILGFRWATVVFLGALGLLLTQGERRKIPVVLGGALVVGVGVHYLFTQVLVIGLP
ncbi:tripartite tricarboxylate transporter TctB family protein [Gimesia sp.]|uniref:tripartite tricarboxylate transporter TctB family protein n=1 Tax=Gimesia sp. TaxID=2024833 RepID=UPI003A932336